MAPSRIGYHKRYRLSAGNDLVEVPAGDAPEAGSVARQVVELKRRQAALDDRLRAPDVASSLDAPARQAGIYPLTVTEFTISCDGNDEDGTASQITERLGNLKVIREVPFMRKGDVIFAIRSQGLVDPATGRAESVDALFNGGILWEGRLTDTAYEYDLLLFKSGRDHCVGRMTERIDLTQRLGTIDPDLYQAEVAYHLETESDGPDGRPTLGRDLAGYATAERVDQVARCYAASAAFGAATSSGGDVAALAEAARVACAAVPGKRYYQAYDAFLQGIAYDPRQA